MSNVKVIDPVIVTGKNGRSKQPRLRVDTMPSSPGPLRSSSPVRSFVDNVASPAFASSYKSSFGSSLGVQGVNLAFDALGSYIGGAINEHFAKRSEERADKRNRDLLLDQPGITAEGRRKAGLNPYGDATLPGMSAQSSVDSGNIASSSFVDAQKLTIEEQIALARLENESLLAQSQADKASAEADAIRGTEERADISFDYNLESLIESVRGSRLENEMRELDLEIKNYTKSNQMALSDYEVQEAQWSIAEQIANVSLTNASTEEKKASTQMLLNQAVYLEAQTALARAGVNLTYAQTAEVWQKINNLKAEELVTLAQHKVTLEEVNKIKAEVANIEARTKEVPATARAERNRMRVQSVVSSVNTIVQSGLAIYGALATGGASAAVSSIIQPTGSTSAPPGLFDQFGNPIR